MTSRRTSDAHMRRIWESLLVSAQKRGYQQELGESEAQFLHRVISCAPDPLERAMLQGAKDRRRCLETYGF